MAEIKKQAFADYLSPLLTSAAPANYDRFNQLLSNVDPVTRSTRGIVLCYGDTEGLDCLRVAYAQLKVPCTPQEFSQNIAEALQEFACMRARGEYLTYPHFLLHGINQDTVDNVVKKIIDNARIIQETEKLKPGLFNRSGIVRPIQGGAYFLLLTNGDSDDFHGFSLRLSKDGRYFSEVIAKVGFLLDETNRTGIIVNVQGRKVARFYRAYAQSDDPKKKAAGEVGILKDKKEGREYAALTGKLGSEARTFVIKEVMELLASWGFDRVMAIKPEQHVMYIAKHPRFASKYERNLRDAGLTQESGIYLMCDLRSKA